MVESSSTIPSVIISFPVLHSLSPMLTSVPLPPTEIHLDRLPIPPLSSRPLKSCHRPLLGARWTPASIPQASEPLQWTRLSNTHTSQWWSYSTQSPQMGLHTIHLCSSTHSYLNKYTYIVPPVCAASFPVRLKVWHTSARDVFSSM